MKYGLLIVLLLIGFRGTSQGSAIDSLENVLSTYPDDTSKVDLLIRLGYKYYNSDPEKSMTYGVTAFELSEKIDYSKGVIGGKKVQGISNWVIGNYVKALASYEEGMNHAIKVNDSIEVSTFLINLGVVYTDMGAYEKSLQSYLAGLKIIEGTNRKQHIAISYQNIAEIYKTLKEYGSALSYNKKALHIFEEIGDENGVAVISNNNGEVLIEQGAYDSALNHLTSAREIFQSGGNTRGVSITTNNIGKAFMLLNMYDEAYDAFQQSLAIKTKIDDKHGLASTLKNLGVLKMQSKEYDFAEAYLAKGLKLAIQIGSKEQEIDSYNNLSILFENIGLNHKSLLYFKKYTALKDSLFNIDKNKQIVLLETLYDSEKKEKENLMLKKEKEIQNQRMKQQETKSNMFSVLLIMTMLFIALLGYAFYQKIKSNKGLRVLNLSVNEKNEEIQAQSEELSEAYEEIKAINTNLESLVIERAEKIIEQKQKIIDYVFYNSHAVRGPLARILGLVNLFEKKMIRKEEIVEVVKDLGVQAKELDDMVKNMSKTLEEDK